MTPAAKSHGYPVPSEFEDPAVIWPLEQAVVAEWFDGYKTLEVRRLAMGRLLEELATRFNAKAAPLQSEPLKIVVNACHDTSLAGLATTLDVFDGRWPQFTASMTFELFKTDVVQVQASPTIFQKFFGRPSATPVTAGDSHYVRLRYQNRSLPIPFCAATGSHLPGHPEFCTLEAFSERVREFFPKDWDAECKATIPVVKK